MPDEITFQNDPVDPSVEFRKQHNHFLVAQRAEHIEPDRAAGEVLWMGRDTYACSAPTC
jgi:hypothetical protein